MFRTYEKISLKKSRKRDDSLAVIVINKPDSCFARFSGIQAIPIEISMAIRDAAVLCWWLHKFARRDVTRIIGKCENMEKFSGCGFGG